MSKIYNRPPSQGYNEFIEFLNTLSDYNGTKGLSLNQKTIATTLGRSQSTINGYIRDARDDGYITNKQRVIYKASQKEVSHEYDVDKAKVAEHLAEQGILTDKSKAEEQFAKFKQACVGDKKQKREKQTEKTANEVKKEYVHNKINIEWVERYNQMLWDIGQIKFKDYYLDDNKLRATNLICNTWNPEEEHKKPNTPEQEIKYSEKLAERNKLLKEFGIDNPVEYDVNGSIYRLTYNLVHDEQLSQEVDIYELFWKATGYKQPFTDKVRKAIKNTVMPIYMKPQAIGTLLGEYKRVKAIRAEGSVIVKLQPKQEERFKSLELWEEMGFDIKDLLYNLRDAMKTVLGVDKFFNRAIFYYESDLHAIIKLKFLTTFGIKTINAYDGFYGDKDNKLWTEEVFFEVYAGATDILKETIAEAKEIKVFTPEEDMTDKQTKEEDELTEGIEEIAKAMVQPTIPQGSMYRLMGDIGSAVQQVRREHFNKQKEQPKQEEIKSCSFTNAEMIYILEKQLEYKVFDDQEAEEIKAEIAQLKQTA